MTKPLLILPFDHRSSFSKNILGINGQLNNQQKKEIADLKKIIFEAFVRVFKKYQPKNYFGILVDEEYGWPIIKAAQQKKEIADLKKIIFEAFVRVFKKYQPKNYFGILVDEEYGWPIIKAAKKIKAVVCLPVEKSGQTEFKFEYGNSFGSHIKKIKPDYVKVLVRYNPLNKATNKKQLKRLKELGIFCRKNNYQIILELLVPPTDFDLKIAKTEINYNNKWRPLRTIEAIKEIKKAIKADIWKLEYFTPANWQKVIKAAGPETKIILLGRGGDKSVVDDWIRDAAKFKQIIGFAIGRTIFLDELKEYKSGKITRKAAIKSIANNFDYFIQLWAKNKKITTLDIII